MPEAPDIVKCSDCRFWDQKTEAPPIGECHRHAPKPIPIGKDQIGMAVFPRTKSDNFCGEGNVRLTE